MKKRFVSLVGVALILCMFVSAASAETKIKLNTSWGENSSVQTGHFVSANYWQKSPAASIP